MDARENTIFIAVLIIAIIFASILLYSFISMVRRQQKIIRLHKKSITEEIEQIEKERSRIAADMHDELGPLLFSVRMKVNSFELTNEDDKIQAEKANDHIGMVMQRIREIAFDLMPSSLLRKGLVQAVKELVDSLNNDSGIDFYFTFEGEVELDESKSINTYRIIQEIIQNSLKHAKASQLTITIKTINNNAIIHIADNGIGFDTTRETKENIGFGLRSLLRRTEIMDGQMFLESKKNQGTTYNFEIPL